MAREGRGTARPGAGLRAVSRGIRKQSMGPAAEVTVEVTLEEEVGCKDH